MREREREKERERERARKRGREREKGGGGGRERGRESVCVTEREGERERERGERKERERNWLTWRYGLLVAIPSAILDAWPMLPTVKKSFSWLPVVAARYSNSSRESIPVELTTTSLSPRLSAIALTASSLESGRLEKWKAKSLKHGPIKAKKAGKETNDTFQKITSIEIRDQPEVLTVIRQPDNAEREKWEREREREERGVREAYFAVAVEAFFSL